jgi:hypothetical protein
MSIADVIRNRLRSVEEERATRGAEDGLGARVRAVKEYQQQRFRHTYADLLGDLRYGPACRFFLDELYGPDDFSQRDAQFSRVISSLVRLFPTDIINTVAMLIELHDLSERLDTLMGRQLTVAPVDAPSYVAAWKATGRRSERDRQIDLTLDVAKSLDSLTRKPLLKNGLRLMRPAARAAGLAELQQFLETGFDTFKAMKGAQEFVATVECRERALAAALFDAVLLPAGSTRATNDSFSLLPPVQSPPISNSAMEVQPETRNRKVSR